MDGETSPRRSPSQHRKLPLQGPGATASYRAGDWFDAGHCHPEEWTAAATRRGSKGQWKAYDAMVLSTDNAGERCNARTDWEPRAVLAAEAARAASSIGGLGYKKGRGRYNTGRAIKISEPATTAMLCVLYTTTQHSAQCCVAPLLDSVAPFPARFLSRGRRGPERPVLDRERMQTEVVR